MSLTTSIGAYRDCEEIFDRALNDPSGVRVELPDYNAAIHFRMRMHQARTLNRKANAKTYDPDHPMHGCSPWDMLIVRIKTNHNGKFWVYIEPSGIDLGEVEVLSEVEIDDAIPIRTPKIEGPPPMLQIEHIRRRA